MIEDLYAKMDHHPLASELKHVYPQILKEEFKNEIEELKSQIDEDIEDLDSINVAQKFVETVINAAKEHRKKAEKSYNSAVASFGTEDEIKILNLCELYDYIIVEILKKEYNTNLRDLVTKSKLSKNEEEANQFLLDAIGVASKTKIPLVLRW